LDSLAPTFRPAHSYLALAYLQKGLLDKARVEFTAAGSDNDVLILAVSGHGKQALNQILDEPADPYSVAMVYAVLHDREQALRWLDRTYQQRSSALVDVKIDPFFDSLHGDPRYADLLRRIGFPQ
jgi:hypothetical protein